MESPYRCSGLSPPSPCLPQQAFETLNCFCRCNGAVLHRGCAAPAAESEACLGSVARWLIACMMSDQRNLGLVSRAHGLQLGSLHGLHWYKLFPWAVVFSSTPPSQGDPR